MELENNLYICHTLYHVYITAIKALTYKAKRDILIVDTIPDVQNLYKRLKDSKLFSKVFLLTRKNVFGKHMNSFHLDFFYIKIFKPMIKKKLSYLKSYNQFFLFNDYSEMGAFFMITHQPYHLFEDGLNTYKQFDVYKISRRAKFLKKFLYNSLKLPFAMGMSKWCIDIEVNDNLNMKTKITKNVIVCNKEELVNELNESDKNLLLYLFDIPTLNFNKKNKTVLILTQVLNELNIMEEQEKYYEKIIEKYAQDYKIFLKPHPRDKCDYKFISEKYGAEIINPTFPIELLSFIPNVHFDILVTYSSTAAKSLKCCDSVIFLDNSINR